MSHKLVTLLLATADATIAANQSLSTSFGDTTVFEHCAGQLYRAINAPHYVAHAPNSLLPHCIQGIVIKSDLAEQGLALLLAEGVSRISTTKAEQIYLALPHQVELTAVDHQQLLMRHMRTTKAVCTVTDGKVGLPAIFPRTDFNKLLMLKNDSELMALLCQLPPEQQLQLGGG
ncbi:hypothetical protein [Ferrimonas lipolytica]|uniref:Uncharacterized protein n=1 Tax=Ferrimonas lipolytica TaxID=2724191 RepID=A0A6H1UCW9_9GAMM|nr:hypothetical protein [Ferrimonas lipolytica]QIZ76884.1 hypothetical protein HER31_08365 [Ferrimonas lipolytica]